MERLICYGVNVELNEEESRELYGFLAANEEKLTDILYSIKMRLEREVFRHLSMGEIFELKEKMREKCNEKS